MPDATGGAVANPLCTDSKLGQADSYLAHDVVDWARTHLAVDPDTAHWAVGGFSYGGTCAMQLGTAHPDLFPTVFDESGQREPTLGDHAGTVAQAFGGDEAAFDRVDPVHELATRSYAGSAAYFVVGAQDPQYQAAERAVATAARRAGMSVTEAALPGGHEWRVWGPGLDGAMPWLTHRMGLT
jgi:S-formylglutathione hydrolase FrmB